jgi:uncharacterized protein YcfL
MNKLIFAILISVLFFSCNSDQEIKVALKQAKFQQEIINKLPKYEKLKVILDKNRDSLFRFRDRQTQYPEEISFYTYIFHYDGMEFNESIDIKNMPPFVYGQVDSVFRGIGETSIKGFVVFRNGTIRMIINHNFDEKTSTLSGEYLVWNDKPIEDDEEPVVKKDSTLSNGWIYRIWARKEN